MRILVTGGDGFIGRWVCDELRAQGHDPIVGDRHLEGPGDLLDVRDRVAVMESVSHVEGVIHLAAVLGSSETIQDPRPAIETNILGAVNVMDACVHYGVPLAMTSVGNAWLRSAGAGTYTIVKECAADLFEMYRRYRGLKGNLVRPTNAYGPGQSVHRDFGGHSSVKKIIPSFINAALQGRPLEVYGDGEQISDCVWVGDVAKVLVGALTEAAAGRLHPIAEVGPEESLTVNEVAMAVEVAVSVAPGSDWHGYVGTRHIPMRPGEVKGVTKADTSTLEPYGITLTPLSEGLKRTVAYYRATNPPPGENLVASARVRRSMPYEHETPTPYFDHSYRHHDAIHAGREAEFLATKTDQATARKFTESV